MPCHIKPEGHCILVILISVCFFTHYLLFYCTSSPILFLLLLPASIPNFYYFIHPLYILDMTDSVFLCYLLIVSFWLWLIVVYTMFAYFRGRT
jgi:hypothetical protein